MKNKLTRIKTTYNDEGEYDREEYLREQKQIYNRQIDFATKVDAITEKQFALRPLQITFMNSTAVKDEPKFKQIKKIMVQYNKAVLEKGGEVVIEGLHLKKVVMESMLKFMSLMMLAPDTGTKKIILDIAHHWFIRHLDPKTTRKSTKQLQRQIKQIIMQKQLLPIDIVNKQLILNRVNEQLYPYKIRARTMYKELDDPRVELEKYNTHQLQFMGNHSKGNLQKQKPKKWIDTVKFPKIEPLAFSIEQPVEEKQDKQKIDPVNVQDPATVQQPQPPPQGQQIKLDAQGKPIPPPTGQQTENANDQQPQADMDFGEPAEAEPQPEQFEQAEDKKRGKLDPLLKAFVLERIREKQKGEIAANKVREKQINKTNIQYEQDILSGEYIRQWAKQKARLKTEIAKKHQSMRGGDKVVRGKLTELSSYIENDIDKIKVKSTIEENKRNITAFQIPPDKLNAEPGLSLFDRRRVKTQASHKPFSTILGDHSRKQEQNQMLQQINSIKQKFSKYKLYTPLDKLIKGLAPPDDEQFEQNEKIQWTNSQMLSNPFFKVAKKKKKKKKK